MRQYPTDSAVQFLNIMCCSMLLIDKCTTQLKAEAQKAWAWQRKHRRAYFTY